MLLCYKTSRRKMLSHKTGQQCYKTDQQCCYPIKQSNKCCYVRKQANKSQWLQFLFIPRFLFNVIWIATLQKYAKFSLCLVNLKTVSFYCCCFVFNTKCRKYEKMYQITETLFNDYGNFKQFSATHVLYF